MKSLKDLCAEHQGKLVDKWSLYLEVYDSIFRDYRTHPVTLLEIGVQNGGSLEIWSRYFPNAIRLLGCDINPRCNELVYDDPRVKIVVGDACGLEVVKEIDSISANFDIIIDDGSHRSSDIIKSFMYYLPRVNDGGVYVIEDLHCSYWQAFEGGLHAQWSSIAFLKKLTDIVNYEHWGVAENCNEAVEDFLSEYGIQQPSDFPWQRIFSIEFINSMCVLKMRPPMKSTLGPRRIFGDDAVVEPGVLSFKGSHIEVPDQSDNPHAFSDQNFVDSKKAFEGMHFMEKKLRDLQDELNNTNNKLSRKNSELRHQKQRLDQTSKKLIERNGQILEKDQHIRNLDDELAKARQQLHSQQLMLDSVLGSESWRATAPLRWMGRHVKALPLTKFVRHALKQGGGAQGTYQSVLRIYRNEGVEGLKRGFYKVRSGMAYHPLGNERMDKAGVGRHDYAAWVQHFDTMHDGWRQQIRTAIGSWQHRPSFSIIVPVFNPDPEMLRAAIASVTDQLYPYWELCIADDASTDTNVRKVLEDYAKRDSRIRVTFREENGHISVCSNTAIAMAENEWIVLLDHDDLLVEHALFYMANAIRENPCARLLYSDEDKIDEKGGRHDPYFKPDWNRDLFYSHNMISHLGVYQRELVEKIGGFREGFEGSQDHDLALRFIEEIEEHQIYHVPRVLYHWRIHSNSTASGGEVKPYTVNASIKAIDEHFERTGVKGHVEATPFGYRVRYDLPEKLPLVSLIIPTRNGVHFVKMCIESILRHTDYLNYEILLIDNNSDDSEALGYFAEINRQDNIRVIRDEQPFNYAAINNDAVAHARGEVVALVNNDIEVIEGDWLSEMVSLALQPGVGAVGAKLYYPNDTLQHAGVVTGIGGVAGHSHKHFPKEANGFMNRTKVIGGYSAVTAACLIIRKSIFEEVGGLDSENLKIAFNDVDFCLRVKEAGYRNVWTPYATLYHHESVSRGYEDTPEKQARFASEVNYMQMRWKDVLLNDPAYNPNLTVDHEDYSFAWPPRL